jgi:large subunit ribosomal protein L21
MYAIVEVGSKQYKVTEGDIIAVEKQLVKEGKDFVLDKVLLVSKDKKTEIGQPCLKNVKITASILSQFKARKTISYKYRRRKSSHSKIGHRQQLTRIKIKEIALSSKPQ